jgi:hypothetical protein
VEGSCIFNCYLCFDRGRDHILQDDLKRHGVAAALVSDKELAIALEFSVFEFYLMIVIFSVKSKVERIEPETVVFLGVTLGFLYLSY